MTQPQVQNLLLSRIPTQEREAFLAVAEFVHLDTKETVVEPDRPITFVDFPESGIHSMLAAVDGEVVEVATVGNDGMVGIPLLLGKQTTKSRVFCQVPGTGWRVDGAKFLSLLEQCPQLAQECKHYVLRVFEQAGQNSACNRLHTVEERCAKWLLMSHDRTGTDQFELTQEFLAQMLGVRRASVNITAGILQNAGWIKYSRGKITILDRKGLESAACPCYQIIRDTTYGA